MKPNSTCYFCGGLVQPQRVTVVREWEGRIMVIRDVPAEVCGQCGEQYFGPEAVLGMERLLEQPAAEAEMIEVPVRQFEVVRP